MNRRAFFGSMLGGLSMARAPFWLKWFMPPEVDPLFDPRYGGWVSYRFKFVVCPRPTASIRLRYIDQAVAVS